MDPDLVKQMNNQHARALTAAADFSVNNSQVIAQLGNLIASGNAHDTRLLNGFLADQLFNESLVQSKSAYHTPVENAAAPLPSTPAK